MVASPIAKPQLRRWLNQPIFTKTAFLFFFSFSILADARWAMKVEEAAAVAATIVANQAARCHAALLRAVIAVTRSDIRFKTARTSMQVFTSFRRLVCNQNRGRSI
jgi:hypothetical protein